MNAGLAHQVEHMICNHGVAGSSPAAGTSRRRYLAQPERLGFLLSGTVQAWPVSGQRVESSWGFKPDGLAPLFVHLTWLTPKKALEVI